MGDTNARTGLRRDLIDNDDKHIPLPPDTFKSRFTKERNSQDLHVCPHGKESLELCTQTNLNILNGNTYDIVLVNILRVSTMAIVLSIIV